MLLRLITLMQTQLQLQLQQQHTRPKSNNIANVPIPTTTTTTSTVPPPPPPPPITVSSLVGGGMMIGGGGGGSGGGGGAVTVVVRWTLTDNFADSEREAVTVPLGTTAEALKTVLEKDSGFVQRWLIENKADNFDWNQFDLTLGDLQYATLLPSYRFQRLTNLIDILPRNRIAFQVVDDHGYPHWVFEHPTTRIRREYREAEEQRERINHSNAAHTAQAITASLQQSNQQHSQQPTSSPSNLHNTVDD
jgi:hypothetical protein